VNRSDQRDIDRKGEALLWTFFADAGWEASKVEDFGRDFAVEVFIKKKTIGVLFNVQLKEHGTASIFRMRRLYVSRTRYSECPLSRPGTRDADNSDTGGHHPEKALLVGTPDRCGPFATIETRPDGKTCTVRVPMKNELSATKDELLDTVTELHTTLAARRLARTNTREFVAATASIAEISNLKQDLRDKVDFLEIMDAQSLAESGNYDAARKALQSVISSPQSGVEPKFFRRSDRREERAPHPAWGRAIWIWPCRSDTVDREQTPQPDSQRTQRTQVLRSGSTGGSRFLRTDP